MRRLTIRILLLLVLGLTGLVAALSVVGLLYRPDTTIPEGFAGRHVEIDGLPLRVVQEGAGRDILMIHGSPGILEDFELQARELRTAFRVTRYDRPGHGFSGDTGIYSFEHNARIARALIERLDLKNTVVVGHSYGGSTALALGAMQSPRVAALVVLDSAVYQRIRPINPLYRYLRLPAFGLGLARVVPRATIESRVEESITAEFKAGAPPEGFSGLRRSVFGQPKVMHAIANEHWDSDGELAVQSPHYGKLSIPVYIVAQRDDEARAATAQRLHREVAGSQLELVSPSGHFVQFEQPGAVTELIRKAAGS